MREIWFTALFLLAINYVTGGLVPKQPVFDDAYFAQGVMFLPYAEIKEPFTAYFDKKNGKSRVDYYGDLMQTYQRSDLGEFGISYKVAYMPDMNGDPMRNCFQVNGSKGGNIAIQSILPDLSNFTYVRNEECVLDIIVSSAPSNDDCERWELQYSIGQKSNKYTMWIKRYSNGSAAPFRYLMEGYNTLTGSHYDKYEFVYTAYMPNQVSKQVFEVQNMTCHGFPGPGVDFIGQHNPISEFIDNKDEHVNHAFNNFKRVHRKKYTDDTEHDKRKDIFRQHFRFINSKNRACLSYRLAVNHLADMTDQEMKMLRGRLPSHGYNGGQPFPKDSYDPDVPGTLDWRLYGAVTPVKDQAVCGSCWSFGTTGTIEGSYFLKKGVRVRLSQQQLIDCSWRFQNNGCDGGEDFRAYKYIMEAGGLATEQAYGPYLGADGQCNDKHVNKTVQLKGYVNVTAFDQEALRLALAYHGPISISIDASQKSFSFYASGVYYDENCKSGADELDHSVLAVGYGALNAKPYWLVKNSWSTHWGNDGYILISQKDNICGVATAPTYAVLR